MKCFIFACLLIGFAGVARASVGYTGGTPCKDSNGWIHVEITDDTGAAWAAAVVYLCDPVQKMGATSSNGTGTFDVRPPHCSNPSVKFYINHVLQTTVGYNSISGC